MRFAFQRVKKSIDLAPVPIIGFRNTYEYDSCLFRQMHEASQLFALLIAYSRQTTNNHALFQGHQQHNQSSLISTFHHVFLVLQNIPWRAHYALIITADCRSHAHFFFCIILHQFLCRRTFLHSCRVLYSGHFPSVVQMVIPISQLMDTRGCEPPGKQHVSSLLPSIAESKRESVSEPSSN